MLMTIEGTKLPRQDTLCHAVLLCYPYREKVETCFNCNQTGHRADVCRQATSNKCRSCGTELSNTNPEGSTYTCKPICIICGSKHETGFKVCRHRFVRRKKTPSPSTPLDRKSRRRSRSRQRGAESLRCRDRSRSSTPHYRAPHPGSKGRMNQQQQRQDDPRKVSWASKVAHHTNTHPNNTIPTARNPQAESNHNFNTTPREHRNHNREADVYHAAQSSAHTSSHDFNTTNPHERGNGNSEANLTAPRGQISARSARQPTPYLSPLTCLTVESVTNSVKENPKPRLRLCDRVAQREERIDRLEERMDSPEQKIEAIQQRLDKGHHNVYAIELDSQHWGQVCDQIKGNLGLRDTWGLLCQLMDPQGSKTVQRNTPT
ncbi:hypothetical protein HPB47_023359 [Ixodes persulcatus]|uniref:Uncharacterized protein n=1 Tax=Ixodes persulcatus TaxID=34615 RepID=A0AC60Q9H4_IXOPE|nr:hypothetical protein HPB47_023359 [Ixodes persulcatus]